MVHIYYRQKFDQSIWHSIHTKMSMKKRDRAGVHQRPSFPEEAKPCGKQKQWAWGLGKFQQNPSWPARASADSQHVQMCL